jgi:hypothetical protein
LPKAVDNAEPSQRLLFALPYDPGEVMDDPALVRDKGVSLKVPLRRDGLAMEAVISFAWTRAYKYTAEPVCDVFQIGAYDKLVEVENSRWLPLLIRDRREKGIEHLDLSHFMIYIADAGCYEFAAESWSYQERPH